MSAPAAAWLLPGLLAAAAYAASPAAAPPASAPAADAAQVAALRQEVSRLQAELDAQRASVASAPPVMDAGGAQPAPQHPAGWTRLLGATLIALVAGFALGWRMLDRRIRRRYGGLRIY
ncbi:MAG TPA: hypothetical protein VEU54_10825 [Steroidobacteraceae bacterium]|jgi:hypothetical protein|nr:hypothetical protein [Steroidobacteraceae bacterium]